MLLRLADLVHRRPRWILGAAVAAAAVAGILGASTPSRLSSSDTDFQDPASESYRTLQLISNAGGVVPGPSILDVATPRQARVAAAELRRDPAIAIVQTAGVSPDRRYVLLTGSFKTSVQDESAIAKRLARTLPGIVGGTAVANEQVRSQSEHDLFRAELIAFPLLFLLALWVFRGLVAAVLPIAAGLVTILATLALLRALNEVRPVSVFALNLVTGAGLGLSIDYSLLLVSRYREELLRHGPGREALRATLATAGRTVAFSAVTVAAAFASLLAFPLAYLRSMGLGGLIAAPLAGIVALTVVPALFALLGERVNAFPLGRWQRTARADERGGWYRFSHFVMRRPLPIAVVSAAILVALGLPFLGVRFSGVDASVLPTSSSARQAQEALRAHFPPGTDSPVHVVVRHDPAATVAALRAMPDVVRVASPKRLGAALWDVEVVPRGSAMSGPTKRLVREIRKLPGVAVAGRTAWFIDTSQSLLDHLWEALAILCGSIFVLLFLVTRSVVLPVKALVMNTLGLAAAFGILVLVFQDGRLEGVLRYQSMGSLELTEPALLFAIAFGLQTDYGVFLLTRIKEAYDGGLSNREAVATGLERTGRVVTSAALLFCVAVGAFATSSIVIVKEVGIGIALAVAIDASLIRALLVPSLMALLGRWNWWAPRLPAKIRGR